MKILTKKHDLLKELEHSKKIASIADDKVWKIVTSAGQFRYDRKYEFIKSKVNFKKGLKLLEIGCGTGELTRRLPNPKISLIATDISPRLIEIAKKKIKNKKVRFKVSSVENLKFKDNSFDVIIGNSILHHLNILSAVNELKRVLKNKGQIVFIEPNMLNPLLFLIKNVRFIGKMMGETADETAFYRWQLKKILYDNGFRKVKVEPVDFFGNFYPDSIFKVLKKFLLFLEKVPIVREFSGSLIITGTLFKKMDYNN